MVEPKSEHALVDQAQMSRKSRNATLILTTIENLADQTFIENFASLLVQFGKMVILQAHKTYRVLWH